MSDDTNIFNDITAGLSGTELEALAELLEILSGGAPKMARFEVEPQFYINEDQVTHLLVAACHEAYLVGCAHGAGVERDQSVDQATGFDNYVLMTHLVKAEVDRYQADNPGGFA